MERMDTRQRESHIEESLQQAIAEENYEEAAKLRDELAELRAKYELASANDPQQ
jgi:protein-arginine kinase activator protein McsA